MIVTLKQMCILFKQPEGEGGFPSAASLLKMAITARGLSETRSKNLTVA